MNMVNVEVTVGADDHVETRDLPLLDLAPYFAAEQGAKEALAAELQPRVAKQFAMGVENGRDSAVFVSLAAARPGVLVARILGPSSEDLDFVTRALALAVSHPKVLAGDPLRRKY